MRIILLLQSLIIIAGAYYIYTLKDKDVAKDEEVVLENVLPEVSTTTDVETVKLEESIPSNNDIAPSAGPNDAGMEWPVFEGELESR